MSRYFKNAKFYFLYFYLFISIHFTCLFHLCLLHTLSWLTERTNKNLSYHAYYRTSFYIFLFRISLFPRHPSNHSTCLQQCLPLAPLPPPPIPVRLRSSKSSNQPSTILSTALTPFQSPPPSKSNRTITPPTAMLQCEGTCRWSPSKTPTTPTRPKPTAPA